ncbi:NADPH-dependent FMN reductase [Nitratireductor aquibiodomus RA22]|uniref:NADPH-dependent FMN reductase n=1 Tax=Nitratireductor aquibiodomus RA22 TaxID=1189611 RepID=I5BVH1_9HYPH|nr:NAD(P)H-dependent oxidoreductase [Nitratireductor aquibiodomus]EIM73573.1 NADPH-dependent FMN reductase [Nitratireductor aquibiodomus RA22]
MTETRLRTVVIIGSTREGRFGDTVARWFLGRAALNEMVDLDVVDLMEANLPSRIAKLPAPEVVALKTRLTEADAFIMITPEYNHGYPASLKTALDSARDEWMGKPVAFVSYGGMAGGLRSVEQLRQICAELHMVSTRDCVSLHNCHGLFNEAGQLKEPAGPEAAVRVMLDQLLWWAAALREARKNHPYGA